MSTAQDTDIEHRQASPPQATPVPQVAKNASSEGEHSESHHPDSEPKTVQFAEEAENTLSGAGTKNTLNKNVKRTPGLWMFDFIVYPVFAYLSVFAISVYASYQTNHGDPNTKMGKFFSSRKDWIRDKMHLKGGNETVSMALAVGFSWIDGTGISFLVKLLENYKIKIARFFDKLMGTTPKNTEAAYAQEAQQSWLSVLGSRLLTAFTVVPIAFALDKKGKDGKSWNYKLFEGPGRKIGERLEKNSQLRQKFPKLNFSGLFQFIYFEAFYSFVCMAVAYAVAHIAAAFFKNRHQHKTTELPSDPQSSGKPLQPAKNNKTAEKEQAPPAAQAAHSTEQQPSIIRANEVDEQYEQEKKQRFAQWTENEKNAGKTASKTGQDASHSSRTTPLGSITEQRNARTPVEQAASTSGQLSPAL